MEQSYELVFCVINAGFSETVMTAARKAGAGGGTILKGRGTAGRAAEAANATGIRESTIASVSRKHRIRLVNLLFILLTPFVYSESPSRAFSVVLL